MIKSKVGFSNESEESIAVDSLVKQLQQSNIQLVMFFVSICYDFEKVSKKINESFSECEVIGCTTSGEISHKGFTKKSITGVSISSDDFTPETALIKDISTKPILYRDDIIHALDTLKLNRSDGSIGKKAFGLLLIDGLQSAEEKVLSVVNSVFDSVEFPIVGGSAGDDLKFEKTWVSLNGEVYNDAALFTIVRTNHPFFTYKENIFEPIKDKMMVTKADIKNRKIYEINGEKATKAFADKLNINESQVGDYTFTHPIAKTFNSNVYTSSFMKPNDDGSFDMYCNVFPNTLINLMQPMDPLKVVRDTVNNLNSQSDNIEVTLCFSCILRLIQFEQDGVSDRIGDELSKLGSYVGFTTYGEQYNRMHMNQTLTMIAIANR